MEQTSFALESIKDSAQTVAAMKQAGQELKAAFKSNDLNISSIEKLQDEMADYMVCRLGLAHWVLIEWTQVARWVSAGQSTPYLGFFACSNGALSPLGP